MLRIRVDLFGSHAISVRPLSVQRYKVPMMNEPEPFQGQDSSKARSWSIPGASMVAKPPVAITRALAPISARIRPTSLSTTRRIH